MNQYPTIQAKRFQFLAEKRHLLHLEQRRNKKEKEEFDHKMKYFKLYRWDLIR